MKEKRFIACLQCSSEFETKNNRSRFCSTYCQRKARKEGLYTPDPERTKKQQDARLRTNIERYGVPYPQTLECTKQTMKRTNVERYGHECTVHALEFFDRVRESWGGPSPRCMPGVDAKIKRTHFERYGVESYRASPIAIAARTSPAAIAKRYETLKRTGQLKISNIEKECGDLLEQIFNEVKKQVIVHRTAVDFYIVDIDVYVQFDGDYWHGLDRPIHIIETSNRKIDQEILKKMKRDQAQNEWFRTNGLKLVRVRESEYKSSISRLDFLRAKLGMDA